MTSRRTLLRVIGSVLLATPHFGLAQSSLKVKRVGFLGTAFASGYSREVEWIRAGLRDLGYVEGKNVVFEYRWAEGKPEQLLKLAAELVALKVDVLVTHAVPGARAAMQVTREIPVVIADMADPIAAGIISSYARPGGNVTGATSFQVEIQAKRLEVLKEVASRIDKVGFVMNPLNPFGWTNYRKTLEEAAKVLGVEVRPYGVREAGEFPEVFNQMAKAGLEAVVIGEEPLLNANSSVIVALAQTHRMVTSGFTIHADDGGLLGYGAIRSELWRRSSYFIDRILKGAKPADLPFERATKFELVVNLKTAKALGLTIPALIMARADRFVQ
jgi:putative ABC transport system substrate-binding protein